MVFDKITQPLINRAYKTALEKEEKIGYKLKLNKLSPNWIDGQMVFDMTNTWRKAGIEADGVNYFTIGAIKNNCSSRFDSQSPYYQAWLGGYVVKFSRLRKWTIEDHFNLGVADQEGWLKLYGDAKPYAEVSYSSIKELRPIRVGKYSAQLFEGSIYSHTDVGRRRKSILFPLYMSGFAQTFNKSNPKLELKAKYLMPKKWSIKAPVRSFQKVELQGYVAIVDITKYIKALIYGSGIIFKDSFGRSHNTFEQISSELKFLIESVEIITN